MSKTSRILIGMLLMAASNGVAWKFVSKAPRMSLSKLRSYVWKIALFYTLWALYNRYLGGRPAELGHVSFGILLLACLGTAHFCNDNTKQAFTRIPLVLSCVLVDFNYGVVLPTIIKSGPTGIAKLVWEDANPFLVNVWGFVFSAYIVSSVVLWAYCGYKFSKLPLTDREEYGYTTPTIDEVDYQPVETADV
mmetsp:Transcript_19182/g.47749  ORF Transcript_19182/g.47749 Transcript_19182/m.47749 type:complete len:192 (+) Transcript_19182:78-653(+)